MFGSVLTSALLVAAMRPKYLRSLMMANTRPNLAASGGAGLIDICGF
jgi:hypothetical protein